MRDFLKLKKNSESSTKFIKADLLLMIVAKSKLNNQMMNGINFVLKK